MIDARVIVPGAAAACGDRARFGRAGTPGASVRAVLRGDVAFGGDACAAKELSQRLVVRGRKLSLANAVDGRRSDALVT